MSQVESMHFNDYWCASAIVASELEDESQTEDTFISYFHN